MLRKQMKFQMIMKDVIKQLKGEKKKQVVKREEVQKHLEMINQIMSGKMNLDALVKQEKEEDKEHINDEVDARILEK